MTPKQQAAMQQEPVAWTSVTDALPQSGVKVLACYRNRLGNLRRIRAMWTAAKTEEASSEDAEACSEYDEATDTYYVTEGWYECIDNWGDYSSVAVTEGEVTHWMPLPPEPDSASPQRKPLTDEETMWPVWNTLPTNKDVEDAMRIQRLNQIISPQRKWVGLTYGEIDACFESAMFNSDVTPAKVLFYEAIEAKLKEKNT